MPTTPLTAPQYDIILSGGYRASEYMIVCPSTVIFAARVNGTPANSVFAQFAYDTVTTGAYTDLKIGQAVLVSRTNDTRAAFFRGRVRAAPTSGILYINETSDAIQDNDYVFVLDTYDITERKRHGNLVDWDVEFHKIPPMVKDMQAAYAVLTTAATAEFSFAPTAQALAEGATISSYLWDIPDATYTVGSASTQDITIEVDTPYNEWGRLTITDSNGVENWFAFTITAGDPNDVAHTFFRLCHEPVDYSADLENGYSASVSYWAGVNDLVDQTRVAIVVDEAYNDGDAELNNIRFVGYFTEDNGDVRGDEKFGQLKNVSINLSGFIQIAGELDFNALIIAHDTTPADWEQIDTPTPARIAAHIILEHSTLGNLAPIDWGVIDDTYFIAPTFDIPDGSLMDVASMVAGTINASFTQDGGGQLVFRRNANFQTSAERDALDTVTPEPITLGEGMSFSLKHTHRRRVRACNVSYSVYSALTGEKIQITGRAPANGAGQGPEEREVSGQILAPQSDLEDVKDEAKQRAGHWLEYLNPVDMLTVNLSDEFGFISPANHQWYTFDIAAADLPRGVAITSATRWLCISIAPKLNERGGRDVQAVFRRESTGGNANIFVAVIPEETDTSLSVMPSYPSYGGDWSPAPSINYDDVNPDIEQPFDANDMGQTLPLPAEQGAANSMPPPGCYLQSPPINFKNPSNVSSGFITTLSAAYIITLSGSALIQAAQEVCNDLSLSDGGWFAADFTGVPNSNFGFYDTGVGLAPEQTLRQFFHAHPAISGISADSVTITFNEAQTTFVFGRVGAASVTYSGASVLSVTFDSTTDPSFFPFDMSFPFYVTTPTSVVPTTTFRVTEFCYNTGGTGVSVYGDAFYQWEEDGDGSPVNVALLNPSGLMLDNSLYLTPPPFNPNHEYTIPFTGTGNVLLSRWNDTDNYDDNQNLNLNLTICGAGAGS